MTFIEAPAFLPWVLLTVTALLVLWRAQKLSGESMLAFLAPGILWFALFLWSGDRRFFFPFAMQFAVQSALVTRPFWMGGVGITLLFAGIRLWQGATAFVLFVELLVATIILLVAKYASKRMEPTPVDRCVAGTIGSLLAYAGIFVN